MAPCALSSSGGIPAWPTTTRSRSPRRRPDRPTKPDALVGIHPLHRLRWRIGPQVNTGLRDDILSRMPSFQRVAGIRLEWWPPSGWNGGRDQVGMVAAIKLEYLAALRWNPQPGPSTSIRRRSTASSRDRGLMLLLCSTQPHRPDPRDKAVCPV
jgi:hypothetical protein